MNYKEFNVKYKDEGNGSIEGYASTWIRKPDSYGDVVKNGAFSATLRDRWNGGNGIPLLWAHQMDNIKSYIGTANAIEDDKGLFFSATFDATDEAQRVRELYKDGRLSKFSFAFDVRDAGPIELDGGIKANELRDLDLFEISCVCVPANDDAGIVEVKAAEPDVKAGGSGGAVYAGSGNVTVSGGSLSQNTANTDGGAVFAQSGSITVSVSDNGTAPTIRSNRAAAGKGGALYANNGAVSITGTTLTGNAAGSDGGAVYAASGTISVTDSVFGGNATSDGNTAGRRNSKSDADKLEQAISLIRDVLGQLDDTDEPEGGEDEAKANTAVEEPEQSNPRKDNLLAYIKNMSVEE